jgi:hypothetical protein
MIHGNQTVVIRENPTNFFELTLQSGGHLVQKLSHILRLALRGAFIFGGEIPSRRLLPKIAACSVKTCGRVRPEIRTPRALLFD